MPLTVRTNGSGGSNIITASWFNDFLNLLTGQMQDQEVTIKNVLILQAIGAAPSSALTGTVVTGTGLGIGAYVYVYTYANADGETTISPTASVTTTSGNQKVNLTNISTGPTGTTARKVYRTAVGGGTNYKLLTTISDNTTTTFTDTVADASLGAAPPTVPSFGGALIIKDQTGAVKFKINNDGSFMAGGSTGFGNTTISGTLTVTGVTTLQSDLMINGRVGKNSSGDFIDASGTQGIWIKNPNGNYVIKFQVPNGTDVAAIDSSGYHVQSGTSINFLAGTLSRDNGVSAVAGSATALSHGIGQTPFGCLLTPNMAQPGSAGIGVGSLSATQVTVTISAGSNVFLRCWLG